MSDRHTADTITDDALDHLYERLARTRETVRLWQQWTARTAARARKAEAALARVRALADRIDTGAPWTANHTDLAARIRDAITGPKPDACCGKPPGAVCIHDVATPAATEATGHVYLSTGCLHGHHDYCQSHTGLSGQKTPATCKFCGAPCTCHCHQPAHNAGPTVTECAEADRRWWATEKAGE